MSRRREAHESDIGPEVRPSGSARKAVVGQTVVHAVVRHTVGGAGLATRDGLHVTPIPSKADGRYCDGMRPRSRRLLPNRAATFPTSGLTAGADSAPATCCRSSPISR